MPSTAPISLRERALSTLAALLADATRSGDLALARTIHRALAELLEGAPAPDTVVDLATERRRRT